MFPSIELPLPAVGALSDTALLDAQRELAGIRRQVDAASAVIAGEIARRSSRDLGYDGLAQRLGARTPELLVQRATGASARDAGTMVRIGTLMAEPSALDAVGAAVAEGSITLDAAEAIRAGLERVDGGVSTDAKASVVDQLLRDAETLPVEKLAGRARERASELDAEHVSDRERRLRERRYLRLTPQPDGMTRVSGLLDPESAATVTAAVDAATSPRRGGPRFVDPDDDARTDEILRDERTTEQLALDTLVELVRIGSIADSGAVLGARPPAVRVIVTDRDLARRSGHGLLEGQSSPVGIATVEREICSRGVVPIHFDSDGQVVNVGRDQRLYTARQRIGMAVRDGGCRFPGCDRPPGWCEAHHIVPWHGGGGTDVADGVLLCRHHHLLVHNNGWRVTRDGAHYALVPPRGVDPAQTPISAPPQAALVRRALTEGADVIAAGGRRGP